MKPGIVILAELDDVLRERVLTIQRRYDPRLAALLPPHVTITGSSGMGPIAVDTPLEELRSALLSVTRVTPPMTLTFSPPKQFMQSQVVVLPLDPHGPIRVLHDRILTSGLRYEQPRFTFTPHVTLNLFRELPPSELRDLLRVRITDPVRIERIAAFQTVGAVGGNTKVLFALPLVGDAP
ncbi:MAG: 2'-5' RNA ligase family protein [Gemmatimonadaceae bacterium]